MAKLTLQVETPRGAVVPRSFPRILGCGVNWSFSSDIDAKLSDADLTVDLERML
jgi:hypothetical protein